MQHDLRQDRGRRSSVVLRRPPYFRDQRPSEAVPFGSRPVRKLVRYYGDHIGPIARINKSNELETEEDSVARVTCVIACVICRSVFPQVPPARTIPKNGGTSIEEASQANKDGIAGATRQRTRRTDCRYSGRIAERDSAEFRASGFVHRRQIR